jgi:hypothetical protein
MKVKDLIIQLLEYPMDSDVAVEVNRLEEFEIDAIRYYPYGIVLQIENVPLREE